MDREKLVQAYMKEYEMTREAAEQRADGVIAHITQMNDPEVAEGAEEEMELWDVSELMCCKCFERWIAVRPAATLLKDIECPRCKFTGAAVETGQEFYVEEIDEEGIEGDEESE